MTAAAGTGVGGCAGHEGIWTGLTVLRRKQPLYTLAELVKTAKFIRQWGVDPMLCVPAPCLPPEDLLLGRA